MNDPREEYYAKLSKLFARAGCFFLSIGCLSPFIAVGVLIFVAGIASVFEGGDTKAQSSGKAKPSPIYGMPNPVDAKKERIWTGKDIPVLTMDGLRDAYERSESLAQYDGQIVAISGVIESTTEISVTLRDSAAAYKVECFFDPDAYHKIKTARIGSEATIAGQMQLRSREPILHKGVFRLSL